MSFKQVDKKDCFVYIPEVSVGSVSVIVFFPGVDSTLPGGTKNLAKDYFPPKIKTAVGDWYDKYVIVISHKFNTKWSTIKSQYEEELKKSKLTVANLSLGVFSSSCDTTSDIQKSLYSIYSDLKSYGSGLKNLIMMDPSASPDLLSNISKIKNYYSKVWKDANQIDINSGQKSEDVSNSGIAPYLYLMYNESNWDNNKTYQKNLKSLVDDVEYRKNFMYTFGMEEEEFFTNVQSVNSEHFTIIDQSLSFFKQKIESVLVTPSNASNNPNPAPQPVVVYKLYVDMGGVLFQKNSADEGGSGDSQSFIGESLWNSIKKYNPTILSAVGSSNKETKIQNKKAQIKANLSPEPPSLFVDSGPRKDKYAEKNAILIDDSKENIDAWIKKGGIGILHDTSDPNNMVKKTVESVDKIMGPQIAGLSYSTNAGITGGSGASGGSASPPPTIQMYVVFPENFVAKTREDVPKFTIWVGPIQPEEPVEGFTELFSDDDIGTLSDSQYTNEYIESEFSGEEEIIDYNATDDEPMGDYYYDADGNLVSNLSSTSTTDGAASTVASTVGGTGEVSNVSVGSSVIGPGPPAGSKLLTGSGKNWYIGSAGVGIAGHRLKPILGDLQKHLRANGYPDAVIGNNGITRDLVASVYPNSPARAVASLHGAGLAIDVTFKITGKKWSGIGDNGNLANDPQLTKVIWNFVKTQGDITWGAQFNKSDPSSGVVKGRGITEYHHFEISANKIADYWKPYESDLKAMGFDYKTLNKYGKDSPIYKVMKQLLNSKGIS